uniref:Uncharacterized protein n=1 Tax=Sphaerodactylus townsendi TaxID=933632 RepID=A0ACB8F2F4_9SAUR
MEAPSISYDSKRDHSETHHCWMPDAGDNNKGIQLPSSICEVAAVANRELDYMKTSSSAREAPCPALSPHPPLVASVPEGVCVTSAAAAILSAVGGARRGSTWDASLPACLPASSVVASRPVPSPVPCAAMANTCPVVGAGNCHPPPHQGGPPQPPQAGGVLSPPLPLQSAGPKPAASGKQGNVLPLWGNEKTMNLNPMILTNILSSPYFKVQLYELKTYHEVVDEIYFKVSEPARGSGGPAWGGRGEARQPCCSARISGTWLIPSLGLPCSPLDVSESVCKTTLSPFYDPKVERIDV